MLQVVLLLFLLLARVCTRPESNKNMFNSVLDEEFTFNTLVAGTL